MEKQGKQRSNKILRFLPKAAASAVTFQNPPFSPGRDKRFAGPFGSVILGETRKKTSSFEASEPTSPKISCMGQIKHKKSVTVSVSSPKELMKKKTSVSAVRKKFPSSKPSRKSEEFGEIKDSNSVLDKTPSLGQMKKFASGRDHALSGFDWEDQIAAEEGDHLRNCSSDNEVEEEKEEVIISEIKAPVVSDGGSGDGVRLQPRKEVDLWKRRTMNPPRPLQIDYHS